MSAGEGTGKGEGEGEDGPLPELNQEVLDSETLGRLFLDLDQCTEILEVIPKYVDRHIVCGEGRLTLDEARALLDSGTVRGVQVRYRYQGADWWDTLMVTGAGVRLVRIRHDFS